MARSSNLMTCLALMAIGCLMIHGMAFLSPGNAGNGQLRGVSPLEMATVAVPAVLMTPTAAMAADGMPPVVLGVGILCVLAAFSAVSSVISATITSELD